MNAPCHTTLFCSSALSDPPAARKKWFDSHGAPVIKETCTKRHLEGGCKKRGDISGAKQKRCNGINAAAAVLADWTHRGWRLCLNIRQKEKGLCSNSIIQPSLYSSGNSFYSTAIFSMTVSSIEMFKFWAFALSLLFIRPHIWLGCLTSRSWDEEPCNHLWKNIDCHCIPSDSQ